MEMSEYENKLKSTFFNKTSVMDMGYMLYPVEIKDCETVVKSFNAVLDYYSDYITDREKVIELFSKIDNLRYINVGMFVTDNWKSNKHIFIINGKNFDYQTGIGINCTENKSDSYNYYKLILDAIYCFLQDSYYALHSEDDFLEELGYTEDVKSYKKGIKVYNECKETAEKCIAIWGKDAINNLYDIIQL